MRIYDAHNHLQDPRLAGRQEDLLRQSLESGLVRAVVNGSCEADWAAVQQLARSHSEVVPCYGCHPWFLDQRSDEWLAQLEQYLQDPASAVGEIGLDRSKQGLSYDGQEEAFLVQWRLASRLNRPASIHCQHAWGRLMDLVRANPGPQCGWLLHSFGGSQEWIPELHRLGAYFSFSGSFLNPRKTRLRETFRHVPPDRLLIETDAPNQPLVSPLSSHLLQTDQGQILNHPANLRVVYEELARFLGLDPQIMAAQVESNFQRLFATVSPSGTEGKA